MITVKLQKRKSYKEYHKLTIDKIRIMAYLAQHSKCNKYSITKDIGITYSHVMKMLRELQDDEHISIKKSGRSSIIVVKNSIFAQTCFNMMMYIGRQR
jgi:DNA-binding MarR family transcriptional regulator